MNRGYLHKLKKSKQFSSKAKKSAEVLLNKIPEAGKEIDKKALEEKEENNFKENLELKRSIRALGYQV